MQIMKVSEEKDENSVLLVDEIYSSVDEETAMDLRRLQVSFIDSYLLYKNKMSVENWLTMELQSHMSDKSEDEIMKISSDIIMSIKTSEEKKKELEVAVQNGRSKESWFASEVKRATSYMSTQEASKYIKQLDDALISANNALYDTIITQNGNVNMNPYLDGFIAEQYHAQTFNLNAEASGSSYRARVLQPDGQGYTKNSVDVVIVDDSGKVVRRYQSKYCKDAESTLEAFNKGDYRGQRKLVADGQELEIKNASNVIESPDGVQSMPLSKNSAKDLQREAQSGNWNDLNWNEYKVKDLAVGIGKQAGQAALMGAAIGIGFNIAQKVSSKEPIEGKEILQAALVSGSDFGIKAAAAGALKVGVEKGIVSFIPKGTPAGTIANIAHVAIENIKIFGKVAKGDLTLKEGMNKVEEVTVSTVAGISASIEGAAIGAEIGIVFGPAGAAVGGFIGGTIGYMMGSKSGELIVKGVQKIREETKKTLRLLGNSVKSGAEKILNKARLLFNR
ncbi:hypothetical protein BBD40_24005 [Paenibacillus ihbetae]|uniref:LXG domain-containing protein n=2 Tax=Paenibacillus ihbetae TaxID=1870820 RepID=A0ABX3JRX1_9BACL|nr:hypothetical protein BBD40_24005 [Paenibacillus ihbetae]